MSTQLIARLAEAIDGLLYMSESDEPWEASTLEPDTAVERSTVHRLVGQKPDAPVEEQPLSEFFDPLIAEQDWFGDDERDTARRYKRLHELLTQNLVQPVVYRIGKINVDILIIGRSQGGSTICLRTKATET